MMLTQPIFEKLKQLRFLGMLKALEEQMQMPDIGDSALKSAWGYWWIAKLPKGKTGALKPA